MSWLFFWRRKKVVWQIQPVDTHYLGTEISFFIVDGWEPFDVSPVPNTLDSNRVRLWLRRPERFDARRPYEIKVQQAGWGGHQVILHLTDGWEPFGVSESEGNHLIWFRR